MIEDEEGHALRAQPELVMNGRYKDLSICTCEGVSVLIKDE